MRSGILIFVVMSICCVLASATCICVPRTSPYAVPMIPITETIKKILPPLHNAHIIPNLPPLPKLPSLPHLQIPSVVKPEIPPTIKPETPLVPQDPYGASPVVKPENPPVVKPEDTATPSAIHFPHPGAILGGIIKSLCTKTDDANLCMSSIQPFLGSVKGALDEKVVLKLAIKAVMSHTVLANATCQKLIDDPKTEKGAVAALKDCKESYDDAIYSLQQAEEAMEKGDKGTVGSMLSAVSTNADTCENGFDDFEITSPMSEFDSKLMKLNSNCLAIAKAAALMD